jgi:TPR repeat protein
MRLNLITLLLACGLGLRAQGDFAICQNSGPELLRQGSADSPQTEFCIGYLYAFGRGVPKDMGAAASHFGAAAEKGYVPAEAVLGVSYAKGLGVAQNWTEAVLWLRKAATGGHAGAALDLGECYQNGKGVPQDRQEAARLYQFASAHGNARAALLLAKLGGAPPQALFGGSSQQAAGPANNVPRNGQAQSNSNNCTSGPNAYTIYSPCVHVYDVTMPQAALQIARENPSCRLLSQIQVYCMQPLVKNYGQKEGKFRPSSAPPGHSAPVQATYPIPSTPPPMGVPPAQRAEAEQLWQRAAELLNRDDPRDAMPVLYRGALLGDQRAEATLGIRYQDGDGVSADDHAAAYWFGLAAAQGHRASQYALAGMYLEGEGGLPKNVAKATDLSWRIRVLPRALRTRMRLART